MAVGAERHQTGAIDPMHTSCGCIHGGRVLAIILEDVALIVMASVVNLAFVVVTEILQEYLNPRVAH